MDDLIQILTGSEEPLKGTSKTKIDYSPLDTSRRSHTRLNKRSNLTKGSNENSQSILNSDNSCNNRVDKGGGFDSLIKLVSENVIFKQDESSTRLEFNCPDESKRRPALTFTSQGINVGLRNIDNDKEDNLFSLSLNDKTRRKTNSENSSKRKVEGRKVGLIANLTGSLYGQLAGHLEESSDGFQARLDIDIDPTMKSGEDIGIRWSTYDSQEPDVTDIFSMFFNEGPKDTFSPLVNLLKTTVEEPVENNFDEPIFNTRIKDVDCRNKIIYDLQGISGTYYNDVNLNRIDEIIQIKLRNKSNSLSQLRQELERLISKELSLRGRYVDNILRRKIEELRKEIHEIENNLHLTTYEDLANPFLKVYREIGLNNQDLDFDRLNLIIRYLEIAKKYIPIDVIHIEKPITDCQVCGADLSEVYPDEQGVLKCDNCEVETRHLHIAPAPQDVYPGANSNKGNYMDLETFTKIFTNYIGGEKVAFPETLECDLDDYFKSINRPSGEEIRQMSLIGTHTGRRKRGLSFISRDMMYEALNKTGYSKYYGHINLICNFYWGWDLPDPSSIREIIMADYKYTQPIYNQLKGTRKSSLGGEYRLFRHLWHRGYPCHPSDFKIVVTDSIISYYEDVWKKLCERVAKELGWRPFVHIEILYRMDQDTLEEVNSF